MELGEDLAIIVQVDHDDRELDDLVVIIVEARLLVARRLHVEDTKVWEGLRRQRDAACT